MKIEIKLNHYYNYFFYDVIEHSKNKFSLYSLLNKYLIITDGTNHLNIRFLLPNIESNDKQKWPKSFQAYSNSLIRLHDG